MGSNWRQLGTAETEAGRHQGGGKLAEVCVFLTQRQAGFWDRAFKDLSDLSAGSEVSGS